MVGSGRTDADVHAFGLVYSLMNILLTLSLTALQETTVKPLNQLNHHEQHSDNRERLHDGNHPIHQQISLIFLPRGVLSPPREDMFSQDLRWCDSLRLLISPARYLRWGQLFRRKMRKDVFGAEAFHQATVELDEGAEDVNGLEMIEYAITASVRGFRGASRGQERTGKKRSKYPFWYPSAIREIAART